MLRYLAVLIALAVLFCPSGTGTREVQPNPADLPGATVDPAPVARSAAGSSFVPNLGQWSDPSRFRFRRGSMTMFLEDRGWVLDLQEPPRTEHLPRPGNAPPVTPKRLVAGSRRAAAVRMTFVGADLARLAGEAERSGHHNYFLGADSSRWRTGVPLYRSVLYHGLYPGVDVRVRSAGGEPEYDVLLGPGADLAQVQVEVRGADGLAVREDGALEIRTGLGPVVQPLPRTWQVGVDGRHLPVDCRYVLLGEQRFGFAAPERDLGAALTIDPGLIWSTLMGGTDIDATNTVAVDSRGYISVAGLCVSTDYPTVTGAYQTANHGGTDAVVSQFDPNRQPAASQLLFSTYVGGSGGEATYAMVIDEKFRITFGGDSQSKDFPVTADAFSHINEGAADAFVCRLDPALTGSAQLVYSTLVGGTGRDSVLALALDPDDRVLIAGVAGDQFPTTSAAFDRTFGGGEDAFLARLDPLERRSRQLSYSTYLGGKGNDTARCIAIQGRELVTVGGDTLSSDFPVSGNAYDGSYAGHDAFLTRLDLGQVQPLQLVFSTFVGGTGQEGAVSMQVDADGVVTFGGYTSSPDFPTTPGAYDRTFNAVFDAYVCRLDPRQVGAAQLLFGTYMGGSLSEHVADLAVDADGVVTFGGACNHLDFPTTPNAYNRFWNGHNDAIIVRLDPRKTGADQVLYSSYLGGTRYDDIHGIDLTRSGTVVTAGHTRSPDHPTTPGAYGRTFGGLEDMFVNHMELDTRMWGDRHLIELRKGGAQKLSMNAGKQFAGKTYIVAGSATGTSPGITLNGVHVPLNVDSYTRISTGTGPPVFVAFRGILDAEGRAEALFSVPAFNGPFQLTLYHAFVVLGAADGIVLASNPVPIDLR